MKKCILYFLLLTPVLACAQRTLSSMTSEEKALMFTDKLLIFKERKKIICSTEWRLVQMTKKDQEGDFMPRELNGLTWVFKTDGTAYMYFTPEQKSAAEAKNDKEKYEITEKEITLHTIPKQVFVYEIRRVNPGHELALKDQAGTTYHLYDYR